MGQVLHFSKRFNNHGNESPLDFRPPCNSIAKALDDYFSQTSLRKEYREMLQEIIDREYAHEKS